MVRSRYPWAGVPGAKDVLELDAGYAGLSGGGRLKPGSWHELAFDWQGLSQRARDGCRLLVDGKPRAELPLNRASRNGISYVQFISAAAEEDTQGFLVESVQAEARGSLTLTLSPTATLSLTLPQWGRDRVRAWWRVGVRAASQRPSSSIRFR